MKIKLIVPILTAVLLMTSCTQIIADQADEIRLNSWRSELENGSEVSLDFKDDTAKLSIKSKDKDAQTAIEGLCVFDDVNMMIYNNAESEPYFFTYKIDNNKLVLKYDGGSLALTRRN